MNRVCTKVKSMINVRAVILSGITVSSLALSACTVNPATGQSQFTAFLPAAQEAQMGAEEHPKILAEYGGVIDDPEIRNYVTRVGQRLAANSERNDVQYQFFVLDSAVVNAFALPGGYIYVTRGILSLANSEDELAAVLGHEIGHVTARHTASRVSTATAISLGTAILGALVQDQTLSNLAQQGSGLYLQSYSRDQEYQADELGLRYLTLAGYNPQAMPAFLTAMTYNGRYANEDRQPEFLSTHPDPENRVNRTQSIAVNIPQSNIPRTPKADYLRRIVGMPYESSGQQGYARDGYFYHPDLNIRMNVPAILKITNNPDALIFKDARSKAIAAFDSDQTRTGISISDYILGAWPNPVQGLSHYDVQQTTIDGHPAAILEFEAVVNNQPVRIRKIAVQWGYDRVYRLQIIAPPNTPNTIIENLMTPIMTLKGYNAASMPRPYMMGIITAQSQSVREACANMPFGIDNETRFRSLNALAPDEVLRVGETYKIVR
jgi:predicted Zn-dependent protease